MYPKAFQNEITSLGRKGCETFVAWSQTIFFFPNKSYKNQLIKLNDNNTLSDSDFNETKVIIIHDFHNTFNSLINKVIPSTYIRNHDVNVIKGERRLRSSFQ